MMKCRRRQGTDPQKLKKLSTVVFCWWKRLKNNRFHIHGFKALIFKSSPNLFGFFVLFTWRCTLYSFLTSKPEGLQFTLRFFLRYFRCHLVCQSNVTNKISSLFTYFSTRGNPTPILKVVQVRLPSRLMGL